MKEYYQNLTNVYFLVKIEFLFNYNINHYNILMDQYKVLLAGDTNVGKTAFINQ